MVDVPNRVEFERLQKRVGKLEEAGKAAKAASVPGVRRGPPAKAGKLNRPKKQTGEEAGAAEG